MKNRIRLIILSLFAIIGFTSCTGGEKIQTKPDINQIRNICNLATLDCYYHNVAKSEKPAGVGLIHLGENDRKFWIEYRGLARLGIDMADVTMDLDGNQVNISLPPAQVLSISIDEDSLNEDSYIVSQDGINRNKISAADQTQAIKKAQDDMKEEIMNNKSLLINAQTRAQKLIANYINQLGKAQGIDYEISWDLEGLDKSEVKPIDLGSGEN
ncbi:MAG: DUF4230 domain-containing protein [Anaerococcus sp.]|nr:DUF4230 domain-containing protein [Peptoniphilaceae bacterium]MDY3055192.1 DUF4230 domain-containing protein [Anaerococcus sp.]